MCGLTLKNYNRIFLSLLKYISQEKQITYSWVHDYLTKQTEETSKWPTDDEFLTAWLDRPIYRSRSNLPRMILKAINHQIATSKEIPVQIMGEVSVEHVMPQNINAIGWKIEFNTDKDEIERIKAVENNKRVIHTMGNLTLISGSLNFGIQDDSFKLKRPKILKHNSIRLNSYFLDFMDTDYWTEDDINNRGKSKFNIAAKIWTR